MKSILIEVSLDILRNGFTFLWPPVHCTGYFGYRTEYKVVECVVLVVRDRKKNVKTIVNLFSFRESYMLAIFYAQQQFQNQPNSLIAFLLSKCLYLYSF